ncbi:CD209 antigen-like protein E [Anabas testudineus]|uniref:C-type lectin domain-containing protein n=1 Tax=Anabas testudineus TaxID=64144 RepID=A0AAQ6IBA8_ANATE|nr:CD209 antigen-like protein E [Anabas testudineus]
MSGPNFDGGFDILTCEDDNEEHPPYPPSNHGSRSNVWRVSMLNVARGNLSAVVLAVLAVVLLIVDISLGAHYNNLTDTHLTAEDVEQIRSEPTFLEDSSKNVTTTMQEAQKQLDSEMSSQKETNWELEHQNKRQTDYKVQIDKMKKDIASMRTHLPMIVGGCRHCPPGWILMNSVCYYFSFSESAGFKTWKKARDFCKMHGGDLAVIDSKDKENATVKILLNNEDLSKPLNGFWIGLRDFHEEGTWKWLDGTVLVEGYWNDGEPNDVNDEDCAAVYARENFFKAWNDVRCGATMKWICEKAPTSTS